MGSRKSNHNSVKRKSIDKRRVKWDLWFLGLAQYISSASKDPSTKVGAVIIDEKNRIVSTGYNGFAQGIEDVESDLLNREIKYKKIIHAEMNAILFAKTSLDNKTLYTYPFLPCSRCASCVIQAGIKRIVSIEPTKDILLRWKDDLDLSISMFVECGIEVCEYNILEVKNANIPI